MRRRAALVGLALLIAGGPLLAQTDNPVNSAIQFNFSSPGARSLGLGGAFIGLANDATAAYTNPAGLAQLERQQIAVEGRQFDYTTVSPFAGTVGEPTGIGVDTQPLRTLELDDDTTGLSFLSYVLPVGNFRLALYRHEVANFRGSFLSQGVFNGPYQVDFGNGVADEFAVRVNPFQGTAELDIENIGVSFAYRLSDSFSIGLGASWYNFENDSDIAVYGINAPDNFGPGGFFGPADFSRDNLAFNLVEQGDDDDIGFNAGFLWNVTRAVSFGGVYRSGASFDYLYAARFADGSEPLTTPATFNLPDVYGAGLAFRFTPSFTVTVDVNRVEYSDLTSDFAILTSDTLDPNDFEAKDATEWHAGLEYQFANLRYPIFLRAGVWEDPAHNLRYTRSTDRSRVYSVAEFNDLFPVAVSEALFSGASQTFDDEIHYSGGFGINFGSFILDVAADFSDLVNIASLSGVFRF